ncbi:unnamed protein product [Sphacelaria rigidula]
MRVRRHSIRQQVGHPPRLVTAELMSSRASCYHSVEERRGLRECPSFHFAVMIKFALLDTSTKTEGTKRDTHNMVTNSKKQRRLRLSCQIAGTGSSSNHHRF